jgi:hypothetical protein
MSTTTVGRRTLMRWALLIVATLAAVVPTACSADPTSADEQFIEGVDVTREIAVADCKGLRDLEDRFLLTSDDPNVEQAEDAATYLPLIHDRMAKLDC